VEPLALIRFTILLLALKPGKSNAFLPGLYDFPIIAADLFSRNHKPPDPAFIGGVCSDRRLLCA